MVQQKPPAWLVMFLKPSAGKEGPRAKKRKRGVNVCAAPRAAGGGPWRLLWAALLYDRGTLSDGPGLARFTPVPRRREEKRSVSFVKRRECVIPRSDSPIPLTSEHNRQLPNSSTKSSCDLPGPRLLVPRSWGTVNSPKENASPLQPAPTAPPSPSKTRRGPALVRRRAQQQAASHVPSSGSAAAG